jgi:hypothetical protein
MLRLADRENFDTLMRAFQNGDVALVDSTRKADGEQVALICTVHFDGDDYQLTPFAEMVAGNPFELYEPPMPADTAAPVH